MAENMNTKMQSMSAKDREKLMKRKAQMRQTVMQIESQLGESATPGRAPVDAPAGMMYGGKAKKKKKMAMGGKAYSNEVRKPMMYGGKVK